MIENSAELKCESSFLEKREKECKDTRMWGRGGEGEILLSRCHAQCGA